jgi:hypothetical protein
MLGWKPKAMNDPSKEERRPGSFHGVRSAVDGKILSDFPLSKG